MLRAPYLYRHTGLLARLVTQKVTPSKGANSLADSVDSVDSVMLLSCVGTFEQDSRISVHVVEFDYGVVLAGNSLRKACTFDR